MNDDFPAAGLLSFSTDEWNEFAAQYGARPVHARCLRQSILRFGPQAFARVEQLGHDLPRTLRAGIEAGSLTPLVTRVVRTQPSADGSSKLVVKLMDGQSVECVLMPGRRNHAVCISTQVGCPVGCRFCASAIGGLVRNLNTAEILEQLAHAYWRLPFQRIVVMGIGEPLLNWEQLEPALEIAVQDLGLPERRITISTIGWPDRVAALAKTQQQYSLAISLHAVDQKTRAELIPTMKDVPVEAVVAAAREYAFATGGRVQFEYVVLRGINDHLSMIPRMADLLRQTPCFVNFIPWNDVAERKFQRPFAATMLELVRAARRHGLVATQRKSVGQDAAAACGQLRRNLLPDSSTSPPHLRTKRPV